MTETNPTTGTADPTAPFSVADAFYYLRNALFDEGGNATDQQSAVDAMEAHFQGVIDGLESRLGVLEDGIIALSQGATVRHPVIDPVRPGAGTTVTSPVPVAPMQQTDPSPSTDVASALNIGSAVGAGTMVVDPAPSPAVIEAAPLTPASPDTLVETPPTTTAG